LRDAAELARFIAGQARLCAALAAVAAHGPPRAWIGAGLLRNAVWDAMTGRDPDAIPPADIDVVFHDPAEATPARDLECAAALAGAVPDLPWSVTNQARMHGRNGHAPYGDLPEALAHWPETATAVAARHDPCGIEILAPHGLDDLFGMIARPTPAHRARPEAMLARIARKGWRDRWPALRVLL
jgi:hypothetical protein